MKKVSFFAMAAVLLSTSSMVFAQDRHPYHYDQELVVASLRTNFEHARVPTLEDLQPGKRWSCLELISWKKSGNRHGPSLKFVEKDGKIMNEGNSRHKEFQFAETSLVALGERQDNVHVRVTSHGDLVAELSHVRGAPEYAPPSLVEAGKYSVSYIYCLKRRAQ